MCYICQKNDSLFFTVSLRLKIFFVCGFDYVLLLCGVLYSNTISIQWTNQKGIRIKMIVCNFIFVGRVCRQLVS